MIDFPLTLQVKLPVVDTIYTESKKKIATGIENKATGEKQFWVPETIIINHLI